MELPFGVESGARFVLSGGGGTTRAELRRQALLLESDLRGHGVTRLMLKSNQPARILSVLDAASRIGADLWIAHTDLSEETLESTVRDQEIGCVVSDEGQRVLDIRPASSSARICLMTSGTTGRPKIAAYSQDHLLGRFAGQASLAALAGSRWLLTYQPTAFAGVQVMLTAAYCGGVLVLAEARTPDGFLEAASRHAVTHMSGTPTFWRSLLLVAMPGALPALRQATLGGEAIDQSTLDRIRANFPKARITHIYASTEAGVVFSVNDARAGFPAAWLTEGVQGSQLRIRHGLLEIKAPHRMDGYLGRDAPTPFAEGGWLRTTDRVEVDGDRVRFLGRLDSVINVGGAKVDPFAVESFLLALEDVAEARVVGVRNPITGFVVSAEVVLVRGIDPGAARDRILAACYRQLPPAHIPRLLRTVDSIDVRESGKKAV